MTSLILGQRIKIIDVTSATYLRVGISSNFPKDIIFDISCFGLDNQNNLSDDRYFIFYNQTSSPCRSIESLGVKHGEHENFNIDLSRLPSTIRKLAFVITIDGEGTMSQLNNGHLKLFDQNTELARFCFTGLDFSEEKAIIVGELYFKEAWRFSAVGQGFSGGLSALLKHFGGEEITTPEVPTTATKKLSLEKQLEKDAPHLINLAKTLTLSLEKKKLLDTVAKVALVLDVSASMMDQYSKGDVQLVVDKVVPLAIHFDDDSELEIWAFGSKETSLAPVTVKNVKDYVNKEWGGWGQWMNKLGYSNNEPAVMKEVVNTYKKSQLPAYVIFISDGGVHKDREIEKILIESSKYPVFWQFVGLGGSNYGILERFDAMKGRVVDNCNFFSLDDIHSISDSELYERLLNEFPDWLKMAKTKGII